MRLLSYLRADGSAAIGVMPAGEQPAFFDAADLVPQLPQDMTALLACGPQALDALRDALVHPGRVALHRLVETRLLPVVPRPGKIICVGLNYADHAAEGGHARPAYPSFFLRGATSLLAHGASLVRPAVSEQLDYEAELAVVVGRHARGLRRENALTCVAGYACFNDATLRDYQRKTSQWTIGKNFDRTGAFGPWMVTPDELPHGCSGLRVTSRLNGQIMQDASTSDMLWSVEELLELLTECMTLEPGDVVVTGTPAGVGHARTPPVWMRPGDTIEVEIERVGRLENIVSAG